MTSLVPNRMLFDFELPLGYRSVPPSITGDRRDWPEEYLLPDLCALDGQEPFARVYAAWNDDGLFVAAEVTGKKRPLRCDPARFWKSDHLRLCIDTRDARNVKRATRYCHQLYFLPTGGGTRRDRPVAGANKFQRARENAPQAQPGRLRVAAVNSDSGYFLDAHVPAACLNGFDPAEHPRIGFYYILEDAELGQQFLTVGDDLNWYVDPSTWATAVLVR